MLTGSLSMEEERQTVGKQKKSQRVMSSSVMRVRDGQPIAICFTHISPTVARIPQYHFTQVRTQFQQRA